MLPSKRSSARNSAASGALVVCICVLGLRLHHRAQLPELLLLGIQAQDVRAVQQLLAQGASPNTHDASHNSALAYAASPEIISHSDPQRSERIMYLLLDAGAKPDCLPLVLDSGPDKLALDMIDRGALVTSDMLGRCVHLCSVRLLQRVWDKTHADVNQKYCNVTPLGWLAQAAASEAEQSQVDTANWLLAHGADPNIGCLNEPLQPHAADPHQGTTPLMTAASLNRSAFVRLLLKHGAQIEAHDEQGGTALTWAVSQNAGASVHELIAAGANVNATYVRGRTVLGLARLCAKKSHDDEIVTALRQAGAKG